MVSDTPLILFKDMDEEITWPCDVCDEQRPDVVISLRRATATVDSEVILEYRVRYCGDRARCQDQSRRLATARLMHLLSVMVSRS